MMLSWSNNLGKISDGKIMVDLDTPPKLSFTYDALYYEPNVGMCIYFIDNERQTLTDEQIKEIRDSIGGIIDVTDFIVHTFDSEGIFRGTMLKSDAREKDLLYTLEQPEFPASKRIDDAWLRIVAVIMDNGQLRTMPSSICQLCMLTFTEEEWKDHPKPTTQYETWDFATETWKDKRDLENTKNEAKELVRRVLEDIRDKRLASVPALEQKTWDKQEAEAVAWTKDNAYHTPFIDSAIASRNVTKEDFCKEVLANAERAWSHLAAVHNIQWLLFDKINACTTLKEVDTIAFSVGDINFDIDEV